MYVPHAGFHAVSVKVRPRLRQSAHWRPGQCDNNTASAGQPGPDKSDQLSYHRHESFSHAWRDAPGDEPRRGHDDHILRIRLARQSTRRSGDGAESGSRALSGPPTSCSNHCLEPAICPVAAGTRPVYGIWLPQDGCLMMTDRAPMHGESNAARRVLATLAPAKGVISYVGRRRAGGRNSISTSPLPISICRAPRGKSVP
jgi:hypothetical protein